MGADRHVLEPFAAFDGQQCIAVLIHDVDFRERGPAVGLEGLAVVLGGQAVAVIERIGLDDGGAGQVLLQELLHPGARDDVRAVRLAGVELDGQFAVEAVRHFGIGFSQAFGRQVSREIDDRYIARAFFDRNIAFAARSGFLAVTGHRIPPKKCIDYQSAEIIT